jgi:hypothetical protein
VGDKIHIVVTQADFGEYETVNDVSKVMDFFDKHKLDMYGYHDGIWYVTGEE